MGKADVFTGMSLTEKLIWLKKFGSGSREKFEDRTATGNPVIFTANFAQNAKVLSASFSPKQDFNGYGKAWAGGKGKNLIHRGAGSTTSHGVTFVTDSDGVISLSGTSDSAVYLYTAIPSTLPSGNYLFKAATEYRYLCEAYCWDNTTNARLKMWDGTTNSNTDANNGPHEIQLVNGHAMYMVIVIRKADINTDGLVFKPMVMRGDETDYSWTPYENICPISGNNTINVVVNSDTIPIALGRTVYGGVVDVTTGILTFTDALIASYNGEALPSTWISDRDEYRADATPTIGAQVVYKLATPLTYQLTPQQIALLEGENVIATDGDNLSVTYQVKV